MSVKAVDHAGLESAAVNSTPIPVDTTPPSGVSCRNFSLQDEITLKFTSTSSILHDLYRGALKANLVGPNELMKIELDAFNLDRAAGGYFEMEDMKMPESFKYAQLGNSTAEHVFITPPIQNRTLEFLVAVDGTYGARITAKLYQCSRPEQAEKSAVTI